MTNPPLRCVVSVSGFRGIIGESMDPATCLSLAASFGAAIAKGGKVIVGRDSRPTGELLTQAVITGLRSVGCDCTDIGIVPTPTVPLMVKQLKASGGIQISASHNPVEWNALKYFNRRGRNIDGIQLRQLLKAYETPAHERCLSWHELGTSTPFTQATVIHQQKALANVDAEAIQARRFTVVVDSVNGSGAVMAPALLDALGCRVIPIYNDPGRVFPRDPEPTAANVTETGKIVKAVKADIGFVQDPDADRLAIIDNKGRYIGEEYTLVLCAAARMAQVKATGNDPVAVTNLSTSRMIDDIAARIGGRIHRTAVGEANVVDGLISQKACIAGEGNGGVIDPQVIYCRDSQVAMALVLEHLARIDHDLATEIDSLPSYHIHKEKVGLDRSAVAKAEQSIIDADWATGADIDQQDGIKLSWADRWVHLRASGTEPVSRIISEAPTKKESRALADAMRQTVGATVVKGH